MASAVTTFTPPASCSTVYYGTTTGGSRGPYQGASCSAGTIYWDPSCFPSSPLSQPERCPSGWAYAYTGWISSAACCPSLWKNLGHTSGATNCRSAYTTNAVGGVMCGSVYTPFDGTVTYTAGTPYVYVSPVYVTYTTSSLPSPSSGAAISAPSATSLPGNTATSTGAVNTQSEDPGSSKSTSLSAGAIAGIAVGAFAAGALLLTAILLFRRHQRKKAAANPYYTAPYHPGELPAESGGYAHKSGGVSPAMQHVSTPQPVPHSPTELPADPHPNQTLR